MLQYITARVKYQLWLLAHINKYFYFVSHLTCLYCNKLSVGSIFLFTILFPYALQIYTLRSLQIFKDLTYDLTYDNYVKILLCLQIINWQGQHCIKHCLELCAIYLTKSWHMVHNTPQITDPALKSNFRSLEQISKVSQGVIMLKLSMWVPHTEF